MQHEQRSDEWFQARKGKVTASSAGAILGNNPYKSRDDVMRDMVREHFGAEKEFKGNAATQWGEDHENDALNAVEMHTGCVVESTGFHVHPEHDWLGASPDGFVDGDVVEVKCPANRKLFTLEDKPYYYDQIQLQMACTCKRFAVFGVWAPDDFYIEEVSFDQDWWDQSLPKLEAFRAEFAQVISDENLAKPFLEDAVQNMDADEEWLALAHDYSEYKQIVDSSTATLKEIKSKLIDLAGGRKSKGAGVSVYPVKGRTRQV